MKHRPIPPETLPKRQRYKMKIQDEKYGGKCPKELYWSTDPKSPKGTFIQYEECKVCTKHMSSLDKNKAKLIDWPKLEYPHPEEGHCVGYCQMDCKWKKPSSSKDCKTEQENYFKARKGNSCFDSAMLRALHRAGMKEEYNALTKHMVKAVEKLYKAKNEEDFSESMSTSALKKVPELTKVFTEEEYEDLKKEIDNNVDTEKYKIVELLESSQERWAEVPVLDGLYGGKPCVMKNKKQLTVRKDKDKKFDKSKMHNKIPKEELWSRFDMCELNICSLPFTEDEKEATVEPVCEIFQWGEWGLWGKCDLACGDDGKRKRTRKCINTCDDKEAEGEKKKKCRPVKNWEDKELTDTDMTMCTPCPAESEPHYSEWADWSWEGGKMCGDGKGKMVRKRKCIEVDGKKDCKGKGKEEREVPMPPCKEGGKWYKGGDGYKPSGYSEDTSGQESAADEPADDEGKAEDKSENEEKDGNENQENNEEKDGYNEDDK